MDVGAARADVHAGGGGSCRERDDRRGRAGRPIRSLRRRHQGRRLCVSDAGFDFPLRSGSPHAPRLGDDAVVREHVAIERIERGIVDVRREHAFPQIVKDDDVDGAAQSAKGAFVQLRPDLCARLPHQQPHRFARAAQREDEEARAAVLPRAAGRGPSGRRRRNRPGLLRRARSYDDACLGAARCRAVSRTKRRTLAYRAEKPWSSTRSCQIATAFRPRPSASTISSRYGSHALALGARVGAGLAGSVDTVPPMAGFSQQESVDTSTEMAGFAARSPGRPRPRTGIPAARK